jgi:predicted RNA-binding Zn ribbon-like protein
MGAAVGDIADALAAGRSIGSGLAALDRVFSDLPGRMRAGPGGAAFVPDGPPLVNVLLRLGLEAVGFAVGPKAARLKRCARTDPDCGRFFVDGSRDGRGRWCGPACGTVERSRRLRARAAS